jgi:hypothetical protein
MRWSNIAFRGGSMAEESPTHRLLIQSPSGAKDWDEEGLIGVENRALQVMLDHGSTVHVGLDPAHSQFKTMQNRLTLLPDRNRILVGSDREFRGVLPKDRSTVESLLEIRAESTDEWIDRLFNIDALVVLTDRSWTYRSVPHEPHVREINSTGCGGLIPDLRSTLERLRGAAVTSVDG